MRALARLSILGVAVVVVGGCASVKTIGVGGGVNMEFVLVQTGEFMMGSEKDTADQKPVHEVTLTKPFYLGRYEVTQEQWEAVMGVRSPSNFKGPKNPVDSVTWEDCQNFLRRLAKKVPGRNFRLPTEAEWEYACRAGSTTEYCYGDDAGGLGEYAWFDDNSGFKTHPVGKKKPNAWGLYDMHGNVYEWCNDYDGPYPGGAAVDPTGPAKGTERVLRGGSWFSVAGECRTAHRRSETPDDCDRKHGLRVALDVP